MMATFGAGCFWCVEDIFTKVKGVTSTVVGYSGGWMKNPTYQDVCTDSTGHAEVVQIQYDPNTVSYEQLLDVFWSCHDPTQLNRQGPDVGTQYRSMIFYHNEDQKKAAMESKQKLSKSGKFKNQIVTEIKPAEEFFKAEEYHQKYYAKCGISRF